MKRIGKFKVAGYQHLNHENYIVEFHTTEKLPLIAPGNFAEIEVPGVNDVFLRRPFSILDADYEKNILSFYIKAVGKGSRQLGRLTAGQEASIIYPLGNSYTAVSGQKVLIVGGGSGIAPFILLGKKLLAMNNNITFLLGARSREEIFLTDTFSVYGNVEITTEDGSLGHKGLVTSHPVISGNLTFDRIYTCGPDAMMKAVAAIARENDIHCEVSLENTMACGFGACLCCITHTKDGNKCVCTDGPVFDSNYLEW